MTDLTEIKASLAAVRADGTDDARVAVADVERLVALLEEAEATLAADQGLPEGALPGWHPGPPIGVSWWNYDKPEIVVRPSRSLPGKWTWTFEGLFPTQPVMGVAPTAREAMRVSVIRRTEYGLAVEAERARHAAVMAEEDEP